MIQDFKAGDPVMVPRTGGGHTQGTVIAVGYGYAITEFPIGGTYRGEPARPEHQDRMANKKVPLADLKLVEADSQ